ncbi:hypothetical protein CJ010_18230 [Azoarcus sp. DD4]|uniref:TetR/AcrR family transcriptional regulator n=1 Tax=Azoarcus sp. DD4 TaxID=2027405 RepID=UPI00112B64E6|nr:TetR/AcrR family transcriptional regulator [Azoarcus sp. DD4]QDF98338.1 hypothetical protein CJ010_18230 [Azoarcus sp. DD4]
MPAPDAPRRRGRPRGGDSDCRDRLLEAALSAFTRLGFDGASLRTIAGEATCDVSMIAHHFGSKAGLWRAVADLVVLRHEAWLRTAEALVSAPLPVEQRVFRLIETMIDSLAEVPAYVMFVTREIAEPGERRDHLVERLIRRGVETCVPLWREAMAAGLFRPVEPVVLQIGLFGAFAMVLSARDVIAELSGRALGVEELRRELCCALLGEIVVQRGRN